MNVLRIILILLLIAASSSLIHYYPSIEYSTNLAQFNGGGKYCHDFLIDHGHLLERNQIITYGIFSNSIYGQVETPLDVIKSAIIDIIVVIPNNNWNYSIIYYFFAGISLSFSILLFIKHVNHNKLFDYFIVILFTLLGVPTIISNIGGNASTGWILIILTLYTYIKREDIRMRFLAIIFLIALPLFYFTPASMLLLIISVLLLYNILINKINPSFNLTLEYFVLWLTTSLYFSRGRFDSLLKLFSKFSIFLKEGLIKNSAGVASSEVVPYLISTSPSNKLKLMANSIFVVLPVIYFIFNGHKLFEKEDKHLHVLWTFTISLIPLSFLLYIWLGLWGLTRLSEWGSILSFLILSSIITLVQKKHKVYLVLFVAIAVLISANAYLTEENKPTTYLTFEEKYAADWLMKYTTSGKSVFTDFRIAGYFIGNHHLRVMGVNNIDHAPINNSIKLIESIYYKTNSTEAEKSLDKIRLKNNNQRMDYLLFSNQFTKMIPGIKLYDYAFRPAPKNYTTKYDTTKFTLRIYDNGNSVNYMTVFTY